jgi:rhodanese-related sulfurtransferase
MSAVLKRISVVELQARRAAGTPLDLVDVRSPAEFAGGHVPGARNVPLGSEANRRLGDECQKSAATVVLICEAGGRATRCAEALHAAGATEAEVLEGGTAAWKAAGQPVERAEGARTVISLERQVRIAAGALVFAGCALGFTVHAGFYGLSAFVGLGLVFAGVTDFCGMGLVLARMPWNRR